VNALVTRDFAKSLARTRVEDLNTYATRRQLEKWVKLGTGYARSLPAKTTAKR